MSVYVDDMYLHEIGKVRFQNGYTYKMSHMIADTHDELVQMATKIGVDPKWIQKPGTQWEHFDITMRARRDAVAAGAIEVTMRQMAKLRVERDMKGYWQ